MNKPPVLDASALIAVLRDEEGAATVVAQLNGAIISSVNLCEVIYKAIDRGALIETVMANLRNLPITTIAFDDEQAVIAASIHQVTHKKGISFADRACLSLGILKDRKVWTSDKKWEKLDVGADVELFR
ncbi:MAG: type II toxin-antitoxin system VapC family toxin [Planctomycetota bacterium]